LTRSIDAISSQDETKPRGTIPQFCSQGDFPREQSGSPSSLSASSGTSRSHSPFGVDEKASPNRHEKFHDDEEVKQDALIYTMYTLCGLLSKQELIAVISEIVLPEVWKVLGEKRNVQVLVNKVRSSKLPGLRGDLEHAFVRINDPEVVNILCKKNKDGTAREEKRLKPAPVKAHSAPCVALPLEPQSAALKKAWWEYTDEDEMFPEEPKPEYDIVKLEPLIKPIFVRYRSAEVLAHLKEQGRSDEGITLDFSPALAKRARSGQANHVLCFNGHVPETITERDIRPIFVPFNTGSVEKEEYRFGREKIRAIAPLVRFVWNKTRDGQLFRKMYIHYDSTTHDAQDAKVMNLHFSIRGLDLALDFAPRAEIYRESIEFERQQGSRSPNGSSPNGQRKNKKR
jgi:hypothetical protein